MPIAAFDFDGTLTTRDTMLEFIRFVRGSMALRVGFIWLSPMLMGFKLGWIPRQQAKEQLLGYFFKGETKAQLEQWGAAFCKEKLPSLLRTEGIDRLKWHQEQGHTCFLVSASLSLWIRPWAERQGLILLCSEAAYEEGVFSGRLAGLNCYGPEKVRRLEEVLKNSPTGRRYAYGDSRGDREMLAWADEAVLMS